MIGPDPGAVGLAATVRAIPDALPPAVAGGPGRTSRAVDPGERSVTAAAGIPFASLAWGDADGPPAGPHPRRHRIGPDLVAGRAGARREPGGRVVAVDLPGHGLTGHWTGHHRFRDNAADVAAWIRAIGLDVPELQIVGHSWGAMTAAALPIAGIRPATLVLLDPPAVPHALISQMASRPVRGVVRGPRRRPIGGVAAAQPGLAGRGRPGQGRGADRARRSRPPARSSSTTATGTAASRTCPILPRPAIPTWIVRGDPAAGGLLAGRGAPRARRPDRRRPHPDPRRRAPRAAAALPRADDRGAPARPRLASCLAAADRHAPKKYPSADRGRSDRRRRMIPRMPKMACRLPARDTCRVAIIARPGLRDDHRRSSRPLRDDNRADGDDPDRRRQELLRRVGRRRSSAHRASRRSMASRSGLSRSRPRSPQAIRPIRVDLEMPGMRCAACARALVMINDRDIASDVSFALMDAFATVGLAPGRRRFPALD